MSHSRDESNELSDPVRDAALRRAYQIMCVERRLRALELPEPCRSALTSAINQVEATPDGALNLIHELVALLETQQRKREETSDIERAKRVLGRVDFLAFNLRSSGERRMWIEGDIGGMERGSKPITIDALVHVVDGMADCIGAQEAFIERAIYEENVGLNRELERVYDLADLLESRVMETQRENDDLRRELHEARLPRPSTCEDTTGQSPVVGSTAWERLVAEEGSP